MTGERETLFSHVPLDLLDRTLVTVLVPVETTTYSTNVTPSHVPVTVTLRQLLDAAKEAYRG